MSLTNKLTVESFSKILDEKLEEKLKPISRRMDDLVESISFMSDKFESIVKRVSDVEVKCGMVEEENKCLRTEVMRLSKIVHQHVGEINELQQYFRRDCVEITGLPNEKDEDTDELIIKVGTLMGLNLRKTDISISHRLPQNAQKYNTHLRPREGAQINKAIQFPKVIVKFTRRETKEKFYQGRKQLIEKSTKDIGLGRLSENRIFIAESLSPRNRELFTSSLKLKKDKDFKFIWTHSGRIYLRKNKDSPAHLITNQDELNNLR